MLETLSIIFVVSGFVALHNAAKFLGADSAVMAGSLMSSVLRWWIIALIFHVGSAVLTWILIRGLVSDSSKVSRDRPELRAHQES